MPVKSAMFWLDKFKFRTELILAVVTESLLAIPSPIELASK